MGNLLEAWRNLSDPVLLTDIHGGLYVGDIVDLEIDEDEDCLLLRTAKGAIEPFYENEVKSIEPWTRKLKAVGRVRYVGDYYKIAFEKGCIYDLLETTEEGFYKVYSDVIDDWALLPPQDCEIIRGA